MSKTIIETFRNILDTYTINRLKDEKPSFVNSLSYRKYKITVELIDESKEVLTERLKKILSETTNYKYIQLIKEEIHKLNT